MSEFGTELPLYKSHKKVEAFKIKEITDGESSDGVFAMLRGQGCVVKVDAEYLKRCTELCVGGYYVKYEEGYESWSPAEPFENGYTLVLKIGEIYDIPEFKETWKLVGIDNYCGRREKCLSFVVLDKNGNETGGAITNFNKKQFIKYLNDK